MNLKLSSFGKKLTRPSAILTLMDDLGRAMADNREVCMMGGGNPARIEAMEQVWRRRLEEILHDPDGMERMLGNYDAPQGQQRFIEAVAQCLNESFGWNIGTRNIAITNGSQPAFFYLFNMLAGLHDDGGERRIMMPLSPEYTGYADQGLRRGLFISQRPTIRLLEDHQFKYYVDFGQLRLDEGIAALCVSRPTNPTGNVLTEAEIDGLRALARRHDIPLLIDNAYGAPFPGIVYTPVTPVWDDHAVLSFSLSKLGLPGTRTGIVVAHEEIASALSAINAVVGLANGNVGQTIVEPLLRSGELLALARDVVQPYYHAKSRQALAWIHEQFGDSIDYRVHRCEGALFHWLWLPGLPIDTLELYQRLKKRGVIVVPGRYFSYGLAEPWSHPDECLRLSYAQPESQVRAGIAILADEVRRAWRQAPARSAVC